MNRVASAKVPRRSCSQIEGVGIMIRSTLIANIVLVEPSRLGADSPDKN